MFLRIKYIVISGFILFLTLLNSCMYDESCACSQEIRINLCINGNYSGLNSISIYREHQNGELSPPEYIVNDSTQACFSEMTGKQRIISMENNNVVDSTGWFDLKTVDCCHAEAKSLNY